MGTMYASVEGAAQGGRQLMLELCGKQAESWEDLGNAGRNRWKKVAEIISEIVDREVQYAWRDLARRVAHEYHGEDVWPRQNVAMQLIWEAVTRHMTNMLSAEDPEDLEAIQQARWKKWILDRLETRLASET